jgi:HK97 family phage major capsid protein
LFQNSTAAFLGSLRSVGLFDALLPHTRKIPLRTTIGSVTVGASASLVDEMQVRLVSRLSLASTELDVYCATALIAFTDELLKTGGSAAADLFGRELRLAVAAATDTQFWALISAGVSGTATQGGSSVAILQDLAGALAAMSTDANSTLFVLVSPGTSKAWSTKTTSTGALLFPDMSPKGGVVAGMQVLVTDALTTSFAIVDANAIATGDGGVELDASNQSSLIMDSAPDSPESASTVLKSLFQHGRTALKVDRYFGAEMLRSDGIAIIIGLNYSGNSPA